MTISEATIDEIRQRAPIESIIERDVPLQPHGRLYYRGRCPFHMPLDRGRNFFVRPRQHIWECTYCGAWGDVFDFLCQVRNFTMLQAIEHVAELIGYEHQIPDPRLEAGGWPYIDILLDDLNNAETEEQREIALHTLKLQHRLMFSEGVAECHTA